jgi:hypothetical protein
MWGKTTPVKLWRLVVVRWRNAKPLGSVMSVAVYVRCCTHWAHIAGALKTSMYNHVSWCDQFCTTSLKLSSSDVVCCKSFKKNPGFISTCHLIRQPLRIRLGAWGHMWVRTYARCITAVVCNYLKSTSRCRVIG